MKAFKKGYDKGRLSVLKDIVKELDYSDEKLVMNHGISLDCIERIKRMVKKT